MITEAICPQCGAALDVTSSDACPKCGTKRDSIANPKPAHSSSSDQMTMVINESPGGGSSRRTAPVADALPRKIGQLEVLALLGRGGMGSVFLGYDALLDREVAIKVLAHSDSEIDHAVEAARFLSEAVLTGRLNHGGIIPIYQIDHDPEVGYYYTMRYIQGRSLSQLLRLVRSGDREIGEEFSTTRLLNIFLRVCEAVGFAHGNRIVHRDLKPANIMVTDFGEVLVLDWGLAKDLKPEGSEPSSHRSLTNEAHERLRHGRKRRTTSTRIFLAREKDDRLSNSSQRLQAIKAMAEHKIPELLTRNDEIVGTPQYLSPEQGAGAKDLSVGSDVYSLGVILYEILTGRLPVDAADPMEIVIKTVQGEIVSIQERPEAVRVPKALVEMVSRALHRDPKQRYQNAGELAHDLSLYLEGRAPWRRIAHDEGKADSAKALWKLDTGEAQQADGAWKLAAESRLTCKHESLGDFRCSLRMEPEAEQPEWTFALRIYDKQDGKDAGAHYEFRLGVVDRAFVELIRDGKRVLRRFDVRLQSGQSYDLRVDLEGDDLSLAVNGQKQLQYREFFPQTGGRVQVAVDSGAVQVSAFELLSRGAPLSLSFLALPDRQYRLGRFAEARELYRQLAQSHPDREEGLMAIFKAGLCSTELGDTQTAFGEFAHLEGTMFDYCCALGLARIGLLDGNIDWAWEALKNGYLRHRDHEIRMEMWFALLSLIESMGRDRDKERIERYRELLHDLNPVPLERAQLVYDLLDFAFQAGGVPALRTQAAVLLEHFANDRIIANEALQALWRASLDDNVIGRVEPLVRDTLKRETNLEAKVRLELLAGEAAMAKGDFDVAAEFLRGAVCNAGENRPDGLWALGWQVLVLYMKGDYRQALTKAHEVLVRHRRKACSQLTYIKVLEALCYFGREQAPNAERALQVGAMNKDLWGQAAEHALSGEEIAVFAERCAQGNPNLAIEAHFLVGEIHLRMGSKDKAKACYEACLKHPCARSMINRFVKMRLAEEF